MARNEIVLILINSDIKYNTWMTLSCANVVIEWVFPAIKLQTESLPGFISYTGSIY